MIAWLQQKWWDANTRRVNKRRRKRVVEYGEVRLAQKTWEQRKRSEKEKESTREHLGQRASRP